MDSQCTSDIDVVLNLSGINILYATKHAFVTVLWASTAVPVSEPGSASILLLAPQEIGESHKHPDSWFLIKSPFVSLSHSLHPNEVEHARGALPLGWDDNNNTVTFSVEYQAFQISFANSAMYWCFKYMANCHSYHVQSTKYAFDEKMIFDDFLRCKIPGQVPVGMPGPRAEAAAVTDHQV
ncbi:hypothetical protein EDC04DRAFT_2888397 [Pisolithus marmoratus]|nr:hypothetical protein EDC04DRAFT_2888397 [Pisolithus marmoratus]